MQTLTDAQDVGGRTAREHPADPAAVGAVLTASRSLIAVATRSLGAAAEETTIAQYRALVALASRGRSGWWTWRRPWMWHRPRPGGCATGWSARA
jgi:hypothetical protein